MVNPLHNAPSHTNIYFEVHVDDHWNSEKFLALKTCRQKENMAKLKIPVSLPTNGEWSEWIGGNLKSSIKEHYWYFAFSECKSQLPTIIHAHMHLFYEIELLNVDGS